MDPVVDRAQRELARLEREGLPEDWRAWLEDNDSPPGNRHVWTREYLKLDDWQEVEVGQGKKLWKRVNRTNG